MWRAGRRIGRVLLWIALSMVLFALVFIGTLTLWARSRWGRRVILSSATSIVQRRIGGTLTIGALEGDLTREVVLQKVRFYDRERQLVFSVDTLHARYDLRALFSRQVRVRSLTLERAWVRARAKRNGQLNMTSLLPENELEVPQRQAKRGWTITIQGLKGDAQVVVERRAGQPPIRARLEVAGGLQWAAAAPAFCDLRAHFIFDEQTLNGTRLRKPLQGTLHVNGPQNDITVEAALSPAEGALLAHAHLSIPPRGRFEWRASIQAEHVDPGAVLADVPHGQVALRVHARGSGRIAHVDVEDLKLDIAGTHGTMRGVLEFGERLAAEVRADLTSHDLSQLRGFGLPSLRGRVYGHAHVRIGPLHTWVDAAIKARGLVVGAAQAERLDMHVHARDFAGHVVVKARDLETARGESQREHFRLSTFALRGFADAKHVALSVHASGPRGVIGELRAHGEPLPEEGRWAVDVALDKLVVGASGQRWQLRAPGRLRIDRRTVVAKLALAAAPQTLTLAGNVNRDSGQLDIKLHGQHLDIRRLAQLARVNIEPPATALDLDAELRGNRHAPELALKVAGRTLSAKDHDPPSQEVTPFRVSMMEGIELALDATYKHHQATAILNGAIHGASLLTARAESYFDLLRLAEERQWQELPITVDVNIPAFDLSRGLSRGLSRVQGLGGSVHGQVKVQGTLGHPIAKAELHGANVQLSHLHLEALNAQAYWEGHVLDGKLEATEPAHGALHLEMHIPEDERAAMHVSLKADAFSFAIDDLGSVRRLAGTLDASLQVDGSRAQPVLAGFLKLDHGAFAAGTDPRLYRDVSLELVAENGSVELRRLELAVGRGKLNGHGRAELEGLTPTKVALAFEANRFPFLATRPEAWLDAHVELHGRAVAHRFAGTLTVSSAEARLPARNTARKLQSTAPLEDVVFVDAPAPPANQRRMAPPAMDVVAHIPGPFRIHSDEIDAELRGEIEVQNGESGLGLYGHAEATSGRFELLGRQYEIERARASFDGDIDPVVEVRLTRAMADAKVIISLHGTASAPELELKSDPPRFDSAQVLGLIMSGDPGNQRIDSPAIDRQLAGVISGALAAQLKARILPGLPIDVIKVDATSGAQRFGGLGGARIELGKFIRHNIYVSYTHQLGATTTELHRANTHQVDFEYRPARQYVIGVRYGDANIGAIDFSWTLRY
jgi:autotransporter translocation and assembly factor TamB